MSAWNRWQLNRPADSVEAAVFATITELQSRQGFDIYQWDGDVIDEFFEAAVARARKAAAGEGEPT